jgi:hypothetical protein
MTVTWYLLLKYLHVLLAITALGSNITYGVWKALGAREPAHAPFALKGIAFIDNRVANPAYGGLLITGLVLLAAGQWGFRGWVSAAYKRLDSQAMTYGIISLVIALAIVFMMVVKPFP